ncbi:MAG TPA: methyltransferase, partial [Methylovirgula sp.]
DISGLALDIGAGVGAAGLSLAMLRRGLTFGLVENDPALAVLARKNLAVNGLAESGFVHEADVLDPQSRRAAGLLDGSAALIISNPPFLDPARVRQSPQAGKRSAHVMPAGATLEEWMAACLALLTDGGLLIMIHRPDALAQMLAAVEGRGGSVGLLPIHPQAGKPAVRILLRVKKGSRSPLAIVPPLVLHEGGRFTAIAEALHRGENLLAW